MADLGGLIYDKDAVYVQIPKHQVAFSTMEDAEGNVMPGQVGLSVFKSFVSFLNFFLLLVRYLCLFPRFLNCLFALFT